MSYEQGTLAMLPLGIIEANEEFNARRVYDPVKIASLAESIKTIGLETPLEVARRFADNGEARYFLIAGFRRRLALMQIHGQDAARVQVPCRILSDSRGDIAQYMLRNLVSDEGHEPVRRCDQARRFHYLVTECKIPVAHIAKVVTMRPDLVEQLVFCWQSLTPALRDAWEKSQSRDREIPLGLLASWAKKAPEDQRIALEHYLDPDAATRGSMGEDEDDFMLSEGQDFVEKPKPKPKPKPKQAGKPLDAFRIRQMRERIQKDRHMTNEKRGAMKALSWALGETSSISWATTDTTRRKGDG